MGNNRTISFEYEPGVLFDRIAEVGDGGSSLGSRIVGLMLGDDSISTFIGVGVYGVTLLDDPEPAAARGEKA